MVQSFYNLGIFSYFHYQLLVNNHNDSLTYSAQLDIEKQNKISKMSH
jgi:hypothetical protein